MKLTGRKEHRVLLRLTSVIKESGRQHQQGEVGSWAEQLLPRSVGKNARIDASINRVPLVLMSVIGGLLFITLFFQLLHLQIVEGDRYRGIADGNRVRESVSFAPRGRILDRNGVVLADNTASFQLSVTPYLLPEEEQTRQQMYEHVAELSGVSISSIQSMAESQGLGHLQPILVIENISHETALLLEVALPTLKGFSLDAVPVREYRKEAAVAHILGYVGRVSAEELEEQALLHPLDFIGKMGVESQYDHILRGRNGVVETEVDSLSRPLRTLRSVSTEPGQDIYLTIDFELQKKLASSLEAKMKEANVTRASGVVTDPNTGEVLAMVSLPSFDNNLFSKGITSSEYSNLVNDPQQPMLNRVVSSGYPSGSVIKPITLLGALSTGTVDENTVIHDRGSITLYSQYDAGTGFTFRGWNPSGLGPMNARSAIAMSSNIYFYTVAGGFENFRGMGVDNLVKYYSMFGLGERTGIDLPNETPGRVPDPDWKQENMGEDWFIGDTYNMSIGQGSLLVSPLQMARAYSAIINGGKLIKPHVQLGQEVRVEGKPDISNRNYRITREGMRMVVTGSGTTSPAVFANVGVPVAGKSGTAETNPGNRKSHAWFVAYAPYDNPKVISVVMLEEGEGGSQYAAPAIAESFEWYFKNRR